MLFYASFAPAFLLSFLPLEKRPLFESLYLRLSIPLLLFNIDIDMELTSSFILMN